MTIGWKSSSFEIHSALYASITFLAVVLHGDRPIAGASSKLTIVLMSLLIISEAIARLVRARRASE